MIYLFAALISLVLIVDVFLLLIWKDDVAPEFIKSPNVSILIAARNEANNISRCLESLLTQNYPIERIHILVGDDNSEDETFTIAHNELRNHKHSKVLKIESTIGHQKGKANVLAQLAQHVTSEYILITDADMKLPPNWINAMVNSVDSKTGIVTGITHSSQNILQGIDWLFALGMIRILDILGNTVTAMGNNMLVTKEAYDSVGGYESIPFSITEDLELFKQVKKNGYKTKQLFIWQVLGDTRPMPTYFQLMVQRKRWMIGVMQLQFSVILLLTIQAMYFPLLLWLIFKQVELALLLMCLKTLFQSLFILRCTRNLNLKLNIFSLIGYEVYSWAVSLGTVIFYLLPLKVKWKGRKY